MNQFFNIFKREAVPTPSDEGKSPTAQGGSFSSQAVVVKTAENALHVSPWYRAGEVLSKTMAQMVLEYQKKNDKAHGNHFEQDVRSSEAKHLNYIFQMQPNPTMTAEQWLTQMTLERMHEGNAVSWIERDKLTDEVKHIWMCTSAYLSFSKDGLIYTLTYNSPYGPVTKSGVPAEDVIHWRNTYSNDGGLTGISNLHFAEQALSTAATNNKQAKEIAAKGGKLKLLLTEDKSNSTFGLKKLNKDQQNKQRDNLQDALNEGKDVLLMSGLMDSKVISQDATQMQLLQNRQHDTQVVAQFTGVPLVLLMDYTNNTYKAPEQAMQAFLQHTIAPMARSLEQELTSKIIGEYGYPSHRFKFNDDALMRLDPMGRARLAEFDLKNGTKCVNELRAERDLPAIEGGDNHFISTNLQMVEHPKVTTSQAGEKGASV